MERKCTLENYQEFIIFLYIYMANSDFSVHLKEIDTIFSKMEYLYPTNCDLKKLFLKVKKQYDKVEDEDIEEAILQNFKLFKDELANIDDLISDFYEIIESDGIIQDYEIEAFEKIKKIISG